MDEDGGLYWFVYELSYPKVIDILNCTLAAFFALYVLSSIWFSLWNWMFYSEPQINVKFVNNFLKLLWTKKYHEFGAWLLRTRKVSMFHQLVYKTAKWKWVWQAEQCLWNKFACISLKLTKWKNTTRICIIWNIEREILALTNMQSFGHEVPSHNH